ncbi:MAG: transposase [Planctomycetota bacterium]
MFKARAYGEDGKSPRRLKTFHVLDPACGSGSFLLGAYQRLLDHHLDWYTANEPEKHKGKVYRAPVRGTRSRGTASRGTGSRGTGFQPVGQPNQGQDAPATRGTGSRRTASRGTGSRGTASRGTGFQPVGQSNHGQDAPATTHSQDGRATGFLAPDPDALLVKKDGAYLPHWTLSGGTYFLTFRLGDSLPQSVVERWTTERDAILQRSREAGRQPTQAERARLLRLFSEKVETYLDEARGACWLKQPDVADLVQQALLRFDGERYDLIAWAIMPNHVHVVVRPRAGHELPDILHSWKSYTANQANQHLQRQGRFWQPEYYDHLVRDENDLAHCVGYTYTNPDRAGLDDWPWRGLRSPREPGGTASRGTGSRGTGSRGTGSRDTGSRGTGSRGTGFQPVGQSNQGQDAPATRGTGFQPVNQSNQGQDAPATTHGQDGRATTEAQSYGWRLSTAERKRILTEHIYGVDIDPQAVEVTKLSLLRKVLEGETADTLGRQRKPFRERDLTVLQLNRQTLDRLTAEPKRLDVVPDATHLFEEPGALEKVAELAGDWFAKHRVPSGGGSSRSFVPHASYSNRPDAAPAPSVIPATFPRWSNAGY